MIFSNFIRKLHKLASDQVLRQWLLYRLMGRVSGPLDFTPHFPPYLSEVLLSDLQTGILPDNFQALSSTLPQGSIELPLPGLNLKVNPSEEQEIFQRSYDDIEVLLALHRFSWLPLSGNSAEVCNWVQALWSVWRKNFGDTDKDWAWHPYTASERVINIIDFAEQYGLPNPLDDTKVVLKRHAELIFRQLEYFGDHNTSNHLSNNGRGLYRLGLALDIQWAIDAGFKILEHESKRILLESGVLREGSSHYHFLIARNFTDVWLAARRYNRAEEPILKGIANRALAVVARLVLPGGVPLIGDISPDCPPEFLLGLSGNKTGWVARLSDDDRQAVLGLINDLHPIDSQKLAIDGWHCFSYSHWAGIWHCAPKGWTEAPGHGHQDMGSFELHFDDIPVIVDPGRGVYGEDKSAAYYCSADVHNTVTVSGYGPYPPNKPYYDDAFRALISGGLPEIFSRHDKVCLSHYGFQHLKGIGGHIRQWQFSENKMQLFDRIQGKGNHRIFRRFITPLKAEKKSDGILLTHQGKSGVQSFLLRTFNSSAVISELPLWHAYGKSFDGFLITFSDETALPWSGEVNLEVI